MNLMVFNFLSIVHYSITLPHRRVVLLCAGILGRYYTDWHIVDEDERVISVHGGYWFHGVYTGIAHREVIVTSTYTENNVASLKK